MSHFIRVLRLIDGVCEELTGADEREVRDHLHPGVLENLIRSVKTDIMILWHRELTLNNSYDFGHFL